MFCIIQDKELYEVFWSAIASDQFINPEELEPVFIETFDPSIIQEKDLYLFFIDDNEGICGRVTFSHTNNHPEGVPLISIDQPSTDSALILKEVDFHIHRESHIHENTKARVELTRKFYRNVLKNALWVCHKISLKHIITISSTQEDHEAL